MKGHALKLALLTFCMLFPHFTGAEGCAVPEPERADWLLGYFDQYARLYQASSRQLRLLKNEIFARHGFIFKSDDLKEYFSKQTWYQPKPEFRGAPLSEVERDAIARIEMFERTTFLAESPYSSSTSLHVDLNGDGIEELVRVEGPNPENPDYNESVLYVGKATLEFTGTAYLVDLDTRDTRKEIAITEVPEESTSFYRFDGATIIRMGETSGNIAGDLILFGDGRIKSLFEISQFFSTWSHPQAYRLASDHTIARVAQEMYSMGILVTVKEPVPLHRSRTESSPSFIATPGQKLKLMATDEKEWISVESTDCVKGWLRYDGSKVLGTDKSSGEIFDGLSFAG